jgi:hypothetical protein
VTHCPVGLKLIFAGSDYSSVYSVLSCNAAADLRIRMEIHVMLCKCVKSQSQSYFTTGRLPPIRSSWQAPWDSRPLILFSNWTFAVIVLMYEVTSLTRGWVCRLHLLLFLASAVILRFESRRTHDHILLSQIRDSPNLEGQVPVFISPRNRVAQLYPQSLCSPYVASYVSQGYGEVIRPGLNMGFVNVYFAL